MIIIHHPGGCSGGEWLQILILMRRQFLLLTVAHRQQDEEGMELNEDLNLIEQFENRIDLFIKLDNVLYRQFSG